eukprot:gene5952-12015_t
MFNLNPRLKKELEMLANDPGPGISAWPLNDNMFDLQAQIRGPDGSPYSGGIFSLVVTIPNRYPFEPPHVRFVTPIYHPNIDCDGRICLDTLKMQPQGSWSPSINLNTLLLTIRVLMEHPNPDDGLVPEILKAIDSTKKYAISSSSITMTIPDSDLNKENSNTLQINTENNPQKEMKDDENLGTKEAIEILPLLSNQGKNNQKKTEVIEVEVENKDNNEEVEDEDNEEVDDDDDEMAYCVVSKKQRTRVVAFSENSTDSHPLAPPNHKPPSFPPSNVAHPQPPPRHSPTIAPAAGPKNPPNLLYDEEQFMSYSNLCLSTITTENISIQHYDYRVIILRNSAEIEIQTARLMFRILIQDHIQKQSQFMMLNISLKQRRLNLNLSQASIF